MYPQVILKNRKPDQIISLDEYRADGGYQALTNAVQSQSSSDIQDILREAELQGRGGAAFPMGKKISWIDEDAPFPRYMVCNADEMEPGTFKDRVIIQANPHQLIEGLLISAYAVKAEQAFIFIRPEYENAAQILEREIILAQGQGLIGQNIQGSSFSCNISVHRSGGRYICGLASSLLNALEGKRPNPRKSPPYSAQKGLWQKPTIVQNVETLCNVPHIIKNGAEWFKSLALTPGASGTKIFSVCGKVNKPGCYELPLGVKLSEIIDDYAGGMLPGSEYKTCIPGGASTPFLDPSLYDVKMDYKSLKDAGGRLGTGAIMVFDQKTCLVAATLSLMRFFARESCGWCTPCRDGLPYIEDLLTRIENGEGNLEMVDQLKRMVPHLMHSFCAFAEGAAAPLEGLLTHFSAEVMAHIEQKKCPFK
jgi:NADH-quinone oxidoreductase subunit F